jgi:uncharacterized protein YndB with AHSA1/START domain
MVNDADGSSYPTSARYLEVSAPERLSWIEDHSGMTVTATFTDLGDDRTQRRHRADQRAAQMLDPRPRAGFLTSLGPLRRPPGPADRSER